MLGKVKSSEARRAVRLRDRGRSRTLRTALLLLLALSACLGCEAGDASPPLGVVKADGHCPNSFHVCSSYLDEVAVEQDAYPNGQYGVHIKLDTIGREAFESFTSSLVGKRICVVAGSEVVADAVVAGPIPSGIISGTRPTLGAAQALANLLKTLEPGPCGAIHHGAPTPTLR
jgi:hypothetical protein